MSDIKQLIHPFCRCLAPELWLNVSLWYTNCWTNLVFAWYAANILETPLREFKLPNANKILTFCVKQCVEETYFTSTYWWTWWMGSINIVLSMKKHSFQINRLFYYLHFSSLHIFSSKKCLKYVLLLPRLALSGWFLLGWKVLDSQAEQWKEHGETCLCNSPRGWAKSVSW